MKIEVEYEEIELLRSQLRKQIDDNKTIQTKLDSLDEKKLKEDAKKLAIKIFNDYHEAIFIKLGFDENSYRGPVQINEDLDHWLGKNWWDSNRLNIEVGAVITNQYKNAFLRLGIKTKEE